MSAPPRHAHPPRATAGARAVLLGLGLVLAGFPPVLPAQAPPPAVVAGRVAGGDGRALPFATVRLVGSSGGATTDSSGRFSFATELLGARRVRATLLGHAPAEAEVRLAPGDTARVELGLAASALELAPLVVSADGFSVGDGDHVTVSALEVVGTPGAAADLFRALQTFPGTSVVDEGAGLFVRGGDVGETVVLLDGATVPHPYRWESPTGGMFGTLSPFLVRGTHFSTGGFGARHGNAMSAVLALESPGLPQQSSATVAVGLAAASLGAEVRAGERVGVRFSGNRSFTGLLFRVNGRGDEFEVVPQGWDANLGIVYAYRPGGELRLFNFASGDRIGVRVDEPSFVGLFRGSSLGRLHSLYWTDALGGWELEGSLSATAYEARRRLGNMDLRPGDATRKLRLDGARALGGGAHLRLGAEAERVEATFRGTVPAVDGVFDPAAAAAAVDDRIAGWRTGAYAEVEARPAPGVAVRAGARADRSGRTGETVLDPRLSLVYAWAPGAHARLAWGIYHQFPALEDLGADEGNPRLRAMRAGQWVAGVERRGGRLTVRVEGYLKRYRGLVVPDPERNRENAGRGWAHGVDFFAKYGEALRTPLSGWVSYGWLRAERTQARRLGGRETLETGPPPFAASHNLSIVGHATVYRRFGAGFSFRHASGRPHTPVVGAEPGPGGAYFLPVDGPVGSGRLPAYTRLDLQLTRQVGLGSAGSGILYVAASNLLDHVNVVGYEYSLDYSRRVPRESLFRRSVYFGATATLRLP